MDPVVGGYPRGYIPELEGSAKYVENSPFIQGFLAGLKGLLLGAPAGAAVQAFRGGSPILGAAVGGIGAGLAMGLSKGTDQKLHNINVEEGMRYHLEQIKNREPLVFLPPPATLAQLFRRFHRSEHAPDKRPPVVVRDAH